MSESHAEIINPLNTTNNQFRATIMVVIIIIFLTSIFSLFPAMIIKKSNKIYSDRTPTFAEAYGISIGIMFGLLLLFLLFIFISSGFYYVTHKQ